MLQYIEDFFISFWSTDTFDSRVFTEGFWSDCEISYVLSSICTILCGGLIIYCLITFVLWVFKKCSGLLK